MRERQEDIHLLFRYFAQEAATRLQGPTIGLGPRGHGTADGLSLAWNVRQLRNIVEQMSVIEKEREVDAKTLRQYLPDQSTALVALGGSNEKEGNAINERGLIFKFLFDMKSDLNALKAQVQALSGGQPYDSAARWLP